MTKITPDHLQRGAIVYVRQSTIGQVLGERQVDRAGNVAGDRIDRFDLAGVPLWLARVDHHAAACDVGGDLVGVSDGVSGPHDVRPPRRRFDLRRWPRFERSGPPIEPAIEERCRLAGDAQHPDEPCSECAIAVVIGDH